LPFATINERVAAFAELFAGRRDWSQQGEAPASFCEDFGQGSSLAGLGLFLFLKGYCY